MPIAVSDRRVIDAARTMAARRLLSSERMTLRGIIQLQTIEQQGNVESQKDARSDLQSAIELQRHYAEESYKHTMEQIAHERAAREKKSGLTCMFAIILGPLIGTAIGNAVGGWAGSKDAAAGREKKRQAGIDDLLMQHADDAFDRAKTNFEDRQKDAKDVDKFKRELSDDRWASIIDYDS
jgi:hypothetical protein